MLSIEGWFEGIITLSILIFGSVSGILFIYKSSPYTATVLLDSSSFTVIFFSG